METKRRVLTLVLPALLLPMPVIADPAPDPGPLVEGERLFRDYGCGNCHGRDGMTPASRYVPVLRGRPADHLVENAAAIFRGERTGGHAALMHDQYCLSESECPSPADLQAIAGWLAAGEELPEKKRTPQQLYLTAPEAYRMKVEQGDTVLFLDVRTRPEVAFLGMPTVADANIPYMTVGYLDEWNEDRDTFKLVANSSFLPRVKDLIAARGLSRESPVILMCRSGSRSSKAARILHVAGFENVYTVIDGFEGDKAGSGPMKGQRVVNGWKNAGLPWSYRLDKGKMYWELM